ncbi:MAG: hypothetical protein H6551_07015 [Chitinophagales bacterium]|nr:hypothetical protein [Chitinophagaceae bacterium]MCB9064882.1 hypothetical protein [Chitinophagales bacterium]
MPATIVTGICIVLFLQLGYGSLAPVLVLKLFVLAVLLYISDYRFRFRYYYYNNLAISRKQLLFIAGFIDFLLFVFTMIVAKGVSGDKYLIA